MTTYHVSRRHGPKAAPECVALLGVAGPATFAEARFAAVSALLPASVYAADVVASDGRRWTYTRRALRCLDALRDREQERQDRAVAVALLTGRRAAS